MPNTFAGYRLVDPRSIHDNRLRFRRPSVPELSYANSFYLPSGRWPARGWLLLDRASYDQIDPYATNLELQLDDFVANGSPLTIEGLTIVQARCVTRGIVSDPNAIYLIEVTDRRGIVYNPWFSFPCNDQYNVRAPAYPGLYYLATMNGGSAWGWSTMIEDLWNKASGVLGSFPGLPSSPADTPENYVFPGVSLWEAINTTLENVGMFIAGQYPDYAITEGGTDDGLTSLQATYAPRLEDDMEYIDGGSGRMPGTVTTYFARRNEYYGSEETVRRDSLQWQGEPIYSVSVAAPFGSGTGTAFVWSNFSVRYDQDGVPLPADVATANSLATQQAADLFKTIFRQTQGFMRQTYAGVVPFTTGGMCDGVCWYNRGIGNDYAGWRTEIVRGYVWPHVTFNVNAQGITGPY